MTASNIIQYGLRDEIPTSYAGWMFGIGLLGGLTGRGVAIILAKSLRRPSVTIFALATVLFVGCTLLLYTVVDEGADMDNTAFCGMY